DLRLLEKREYDMSAFKATVGKLACGERLPPKNRDHALSGNWTDYRECHIEPDWLLIYRIENDILVLVLARTGTHSDLF
ncbi:MAG: type II toxin-antitoxin system YafQ family toxin, partial [Clostridiales bacterium]|nr:type II toxin-antitoxin system YafQ family toxin [Clostridiales bacterium]